MEQGRLGKVYQPSDVLIRQGDGSECIYVIQEGQVAIVQQQQGKEVFLGLRGAGDFVGELSIFDKHVHSATVRAVSQVRVLTIDRNNFQRRIHEDPSIAYRLFQVMARRVRDLSQEVTLLEQELDRLTERGSERDTKEDKQLNQA